MDGTSTYPPAFVLFDRPNGDNRREILDAVWKFKQWDNKLDPLLQKLNQLFLDYATKSLFFHGRPDWSAPAEAFAQFGDVHVILKLWWMRDGISEPFPTGICFGERHAFIHLRA